MQVFSNDDTERIERIVNECLTSGQDLHAVGPYSIFKACSVFSTNPLPSHYSVAFYSDNSISGIQIKPVESTNYTNERAHVSMKVSKSTDAKALAIAMIKSFGEQKYPVLRAIGPHSTNACIKAFAIASQKKEEPIVFSMTSKRSDDFTQLIFEWISPLTPTVE